MVLRKLAVALLSVGVMLPGLGHALAVRDLQTKSALGEPFQGEIELVEVGDLNADEIKVSLATQEDFERLGVERVYFLTDLRFDVVLNAGGRSFVKISSSKPVREPFLDFVVRIAWPGNTRLQGVTALLDPPVMADTAPSEVARPVSTQQPVVPVTPAAVAPVSEAPQEVVAEPPKPVLPPSRPVAEKPVRQPAPEEQPKPVPQPDSYRTRSGDTMWKVAEQLRPNGSVTVPQTMIAIQRANPNAFAGDNINQLKRGQVLRVPSESQIREVSAKEAAASIHDQAKAWRAAQAPAAAEKPALDAQQVNATAPQEVPKPATAAPKPEVKLLAAQTGKAGASSAGKDQGAAKPADAKKLDENRLKAEAAKAEKEKLAAKVGALDTKVKANDKQLEVQNAKLADLQSKLKEQQAKAAAAKTAAAAPQPAPEAAKPPVKPAAGPTATAEELDAITNPDTAAKNAAKTAGAEVAPAVAAKPLPAPASAKPAVVSKPAPVQPAEESSSLPLIAGGAGLLALLGGAFFFLKRRREKTAEEEEAMAELEGVDDRLAQIGGGETDVADNFVFGGAQHDDRHQQADELSFPDTSFDDLEPVVAQDRVLADPLEEVEQYLAFERYPQAVGFLVKAIAANPDRADLRMKLLEVYAHLDDHNGFAEQEAWFEQAGDLGSLARAEELKATMSGLPAAKGDDELLAFEPGLGKAAVSTHDDIASLEDLEMDFNASVSASSPSLQAVSDADLDLDADFSLGDTKPQAADSGLSLDEDLDFSFDSKPAAAAPAAPADDLSFELDDAAFESAAPVAEAKTSAADEGMDFSLDEVSLDEPKLDTSSAGLGEFDLADFDMDAPLAQPEAAAPVAKPAEDDLSFSLDDLEASASEPVAAAAESFDLEGDFSLDEGSSSDFGFDETVHADSGMNDAAADFDAALSLDNVAGAAVAEVAPVAAPVASVAAEAPGMDDEFDFLADTDENATKLDLARAYIDMGDMEGARDILQEVLNEGNTTQKDEAKGLLAQVG